MVISEIMVDSPSAWGGTNSLEFIELYNSGLITEDLTGHRFSGEIDYAFPAGTTLAPGAFIVIAKDPVAAQSFYGISCQGPYDGKLSNSGGTLRFRNELNGILLEIEYDNRAPWPVAAFGSGHSMVLSNPSYGENDPRAWSSSDIIGGSPGADETVGSEPARGVVINEYLAHTDLPFVDYIELFNTGTVAVDLSGAWLSDEAGTNKYRIADGTTIPARGFLHFDQNELGFALAADGEEIFLINAARTRVLDAVSFQGQANGISEGRYPDGAPTFQALASVTEGRANDVPLLRSVVINEIMYHPISESNDDEYIELYNRSGIPVDLAGWRIQGGVSYRFPDHAEIPAHGYVVIAENATNLITKYTQLNSSNTFGNYAGSLADGGERITLTMPDDLISTNEFGTVITNWFTIPMDEVTYLDGGRWGRWSDGGGSSLELIDPDADNRQPASWADSDETSKAPWTLIDVTNVLENGQAWIDEGTIYGTAAQCNRLELFQQGAGEALIDDVEFLNNDGASLVRNGTFASGMNYWGSGGVTRNSYAENGVGYDGSIALHLVSADRGDTGCNKTYNELSSVPTIRGTDTGTIRAKVRWLKGAKQVLLRLRGNWMEVCTDLEVPSNCGTPGLVNSRMVSNAAPAIHDVIHQPVLPAGGEDVVVTARAVDPDGISTMTLSYRTDPSTVYSTAIMNDSGSAGDAIAGDGIYSATIPGQSSGTMVAFFVSANDGSATSRFPEEAPDRECLIHWGETMPDGDLGSYRLWVTQANLAFWKSRERNANDPLDATFVYGNSRVIYNVDTMYSGSPFHVWSYSGPLGGTPCDYEINFHEDERFLGSKPFVLAAEDGSTGDPTTQVDITGTWVARMLGQQYNYRRHVHMIVNGQQRGMIYLDSQQPNGEMLDEYYPDDTKDELRKVEGWFEFDDAFNNHGNIFARIDAVQKSSGGLDTKWYRWNWRPRTTQDHNNWFNFTNLVTAVTDTASTDYEGRIRTWMDVPNFLRPIVAHHACGSWDSYAYDRGKNMYAYKPDDQGWRLFMWDIEFALGISSAGTTANIYQSVDSTMMNMIRSIPSIHREYLMGFQEVVDGPFAPGVAAAILNERYDNLLANGVGVNSPQSIINWINARRSYLQGILPSASFTVDGSTAFTVASNNTVLTGRAPLTVTEIQVNATPYPVEWTSTTTWKMVVPLSSGLNSLTVTGIDRHGNPVDGSGALLNITCSVSDPDPEGIVVINEIHPSPEDRDLQFIELYNTSTTNVFDLSGWRINGVGYAFPSGSIIGPGEYIVLAKNRYRFASLHSDITLFDIYDGSLDPEGETLSLFRPGAITEEEILVDRVRYESTAPWADYTAGRSLQLIDAAQDNSRVANWATTQDAPPSEPVNVISIDDSWKFYESGDPGSGWEQSGFDDSTWDSGNALLYVESSSLPASKNTPLDLGETAYYFRKSFNYSGKTAGITLNVSTIVDDAVILYLNGNEILRLGMPAGAVSHVTPADRTVTDAAYEFFVLPATALLAGENVLAAEVHQINESSSDVVFGITLDVIDGGAESLTPGQPNAVRAILPAFPNLWLNELQAENITGPMDNTGDRDPWIEIHNSGETSVNMDDCRLTTDYDNPSGWSFPTGTTIPAGGYLMVWCDSEIDESVSGAPHADVGLPASAGTIGLARMVDGSPRLFDYLNYTNLPANWSYGDFPDGQPFYRFNLFYPTAGSANNHAAPPLVVKINEWMADNDKTLIDLADNDYEDWFELYNPGTNTVDLGGSFLTDDFTDPFKFEVPNNGHYTIEPEGYLLVWADGETGQNSTNRADLHADFSLSKNGDAIAVYASDGSMIDSVTFGPLATDVSEGRYPAGGDTIIQQSSPTPGIANAGPTTLPMIDSISINGSSCILLWDSLPGSSYQVYFKSNLMDSVWIPTGELQSGTGAPIGYTNLLFGKQGYYIIEIQ
ncbi:MAG: lamin tail domain-containing protein [Pontiellaceae bacterium]|nr:lamin tail domain-containing protein [Pontiellaceae bacterium]MBN2785826.1 lamin tail domain-containing protein [Pontiellaceae bacterium]